MVLPPDDIGGPKLVALATVCDVVPLKGLNRAYVTQGLKIMARRENLGVACLSDVARLKRKPDTYALGYLLGPRINAAGRIGNAAMALTLLTTQDKGVAAQIAQELERLNRERQEIELAVVDQAMVQADNMLGAERRASVLVVSGRGWHPGVVGLAAALCFATGSWWGLLAGALLMQASLIIDCVDGEVARFTRTFSSLGAWLAERRRPWDELAPIVAGVLDGVAAAHAAGVQAAAEELAEMAWQRRERLSSPRW